MGTEQNATAHPGRIGGIPRAVSVDFHEPMEVDWRLGKAGRRATGELAKACYHGACPPAFPDDQTHSRRFEANTLRVLGSRPTVLGLTAPKTV